MKNYVKDLDKIFQDVLRQEKKSRRSFFYYIAIPVMLGIFILYYTSKTTIEKDLATKELEQLTKAKDKYSFIASKVSKYLDLRNAHLAKKLDSMYSDNIDVFLKLHSVTKKEVFDYDSIYWKDDVQESFIEAEYPQVSQTVDSNFVTLTKIKYKKGASNYKKRDLIFEIRLNKKYEIFYVNAYQSADIHNLFK
jgi:hypothetical protein